MENLEQEKRFEKGVYVVKMTFLNRQGEEKTITHETHLWSDGTIADLEKAVRSDVVMTGLHNFNMDVYIGRYPKGHPVRISISDDNGLEVHSMVLPIDSSGYVVQP